MTFYEQIQNSINYVEANLSLAISISQVAEIAGMSVANFYRYFTAMTGFTFKEYVRRRRLANSLLRLKKTSENIIDLAFEACFESHEAFSRAFKKEFGLSPSEYRKSRRYIQGLNSLKLFKETFMGIVIKELPEMKVAFYRVISRAPEDDCWNHIKSWAETNGVFKQPYRIFGFNNPSPQDMQKLTDKKGNEFFINAEHREYGYEFLIQTDVDLPAENSGRGVNFKTIKSGKFAVMSIGVGCEEHDIEKGWGKFSRLIEEGGYKPTGRWFEEHLEYDLTGQNKNFRMDLYIEIS